MTDDEAPAAPEPSSEQAAVRAAGHAFASPDGVETDGSMARGGVPRESAVAVGRVQDTQSAEALDRLRRAGIPAFLHDDRAPQATVYVDEPDADDARIVLATLGPAVQPPDSPAPAPRAPQLGDGAVGCHHDEPGADESAAQDASVDELLERPLSDDDVDARFSELIGQLEQAPPRIDDPRGDDPRGGPAAPMDDLPPARETPDEVSARLGDPPDPPELREDHFERPLPPPMPRPSVAGAVAILVVLLGVAILAFGRLAGLSADESLTVGVMVTLAGALLLGRRLKQHRDDSDDGAVL